MLIVPNERKDIKRKISSFVCPGTGGTRWGPARQLWHRCWVRSGVRAVHQPVHYASLLGAQEVIKSSSRELIKSSSTEVIPSPFFPKSFSLSAVLKLIYYPVHRSYTKTDVAHRRRTTPPPPPGSRDCIIHCRIHRCLNQIEIEIDQREPETLSSPRIDVIYTTARWWAITLA